MPRSNCALLAAPAAARQAREPRGHRDLHSSMHAKLLHLHRACLRAKMDGQTHSPLATRPHSSAPARRAARLELIPVRAGPQAACRPATGGPHIQAATLLSRSAPTALSRCVWGSRCRGVPTAAALAGLARQGMSEDDRLPRNPNPLEGCGYTRPRNPRPASTCISSICNVCHGACRFLPAGCCSPRNHGATA